VNADDGVYILCACVTDPDVHHPAVDVYAAGSPISANSASKRTSALSSE
jgi:hypothetical protein